MRIYWFVLYFIVVGVHQRRLSSELCFLINMLLWSAEHMTFVDD
jgi:hypothetical protein